MHSPPALPWLDALRDPATYPHPCGTIEIVHTHLSVLALTGQFAYKLKKPMDYGFADFSTLEKRKHYCEEELRLNRRTAPELYLDVVPLVKTGKGWRIKGTGPRPSGSGAVDVGLLGSEAVEFAVKMREFDPKLGLDRIAERGELTPSMFESLAASIARLHETAERADAKMAASYPDRLAKAIHDNFEHLPDTEQERTLRKAFDAQLARQRPLLEARAKEGQVRDGHGDLHLANICLWQGTPVPFDCIEFNPGLRVIDVLSDAAFLCMDLRERGFPALAQRFLTLYLERTGDYAGLPAWPLFVAYRAHVRAKIAQLTLTAPGVPASRRKELETARETYLRLANATLAAPSGGLAAMAGLPGSGKSTVALRLACEGNGLRVRSDVERKRLHAADPSRDLYGSEMGRATYGKLLEIARAVVAGGMTAILDATYLRRAHRKPVIDLAKELGVPLRFVHCDVPMEVLRERVRQRAAEGRDVSDADEQVLEEMAKSWEPFSVGEKPFVYQKHDLTTEDTEDTEN